LSFTAAGFAATKLRMPVFEGSLILCHELPLTELMGMMELPCIRMTYIRPSPMPRIVRFARLNRYGLGQHFATHGDRAIRAVPSPPVRIRTDLSVTLFQAPEDYDGGEPTVEDKYGTHEVKLPAGDRVLYPSTSLHHVEPVTRGVRVASFFWLQNMIRDDGARSLLFDLRSNHSGAFARARCSGCRLPAPDRRLPQSDRLLGGCIA